MSTLDELADRFMVCGRPQAVIDEETLLGWASSQSISPPAAQMAALERGIMPLRYVKNQSGLQWGEQARLCRSRVLLCGCGGLGGVVASLLARVGVGFLRLVDGDVFAVTNLNRQWFSDLDSLGRNKADTARKRLGRINPFVEVEALPCTLDASNAMQLLDTMDLVVDAVDNLPSRFELFEAAQRAGIPFIHGAVAGWWGQVATFLPGSRTHLHQVYGGRRERAEAEEHLGVLGATAALIGSLQALEAVRLLAGRRPAHAENWLYYDGETGEQVRVPFGSLK